MLILFINMYMSPLNMELGEEDVGVRLGRQGGWANGRAVGGDATARVERRAREVASPLGRQSAKQLVWLQFDLTWVADFDWARAGGPAGFGYDGLP